MKFQPCGSFKEHGRHEWYWHSILRRDCQGRCGHGAGAPAECLECEMESLIEQHVRDYHPGEECPEDGGGRCAARAWSIGRTADPSPGAPHVGGPNV